MIRSHIAPSTWTFTERASIPVKSSTNHFSTLGSKRINLRPVWNGQNDVFSDAGDAIQNGAKWRTNGAVVDFSLTWSQLHNLCLPWRRRVKPKGSVKKTAERKLDQRADGWSPTLHLTWNPNMGMSKRKVIFQLQLLEFRVKFWGGSNFEESM